MESSTSKCFIFVNLTMWCLFSCSSSFLLFVLPFIGAQFKWKTYAKWLKYFVWLYSSFAIRFSPPRIFHAWRHFCCFFTSTTFIYVLLFSVGCWLILLLLLLFYVFFFFSFKLAFSFGFACPSLLCAKLEPNQTMQYKKQTRTHSTNNSHEKNETKTMRIMKNSRDGVWQPFTLTLTTH